MKIIVVIFMVIISNCLIFNFIVYINVLENSLNNNFLYANDKTNILPFIKFNIYF